MAALAALLATATTAAVAPAAVAAAGTAGAAPAASGAMPARHLDAPPSRRPAPPAPEIDGGGILVRFRPASTPAAVLARHGLAGATRRAIGRTGYDFVPVRGGDVARARQQLAADPDVVDASLDYRRHATAVPNDPAYQAGAQPYLDTMRLPQAWDLSRGAAGLVVAVVDSGVNASHPDLFGRVLPGHDFVDGDDDASDQAGHGTEVAGALAAKTDNGVGVAGAAWDASILPVRVLDASGAGNDGAIAAGITYAVDHGARIINLSLGGPGDSSVLDRAIDDAIAHDVLVVAAAGNSSLDVPFFPAAYPPVLAVSATDDNGRSAYFTEYGPWVDLAAPGVAIVTTAMNGGYAANSGTSFSAPLVSGVAALLRAQRPSWTVAQVTEQLRASALDVGPPGDDPIYGAGFVDAYAAVGGPVQAPVVAAGDGGADDDADGAQPLAGSAAGTIAPEGDADWYRYDVSVPGPFSVTVTPTTNNGAAQVLDPIVEVYDSSLHLVVSADAAGPNAAETASFLAATPATYFIRTSNFAPTVSPGTYAISIQSGAGTAIAGSTQSWIERRDPPEHSAGAPTTTDVAVRFARAVDQTTVSSSTVRLVHGRTGATIPATVAYDAPSRTAVLHPASPLPPGTAVHVVTAGVSDGNGGQLTGVVLRFRTAGTTPAVVLPPPPPPPVPAPPAPPAPAPAPPAPRSGYWMVGSDGSVYSFGDARWAGNVTGLRNGTSAVDLEPTPSRNGYWVVTSTGQVYAFGDAPWFGGLSGGLTNGETVTSLSSTATGAGYWLFTTRGRVFTFGDAPFLGDMAGTRLNGPVLDSIPSASGNGYYMVASDGGIFTFGDAGFRGSMGATHLNAPVQSLVPDADGDGYWLVASDGGIFAFDAPFYGSMGDVRLNRPVTGMVGFRQGYLMVAEDGGIFTFGDAVFSGSLGDSPPAHPITSVAAFG